MLRLGVPGEIIIILSSLVPICILVEEKNKSDQTNGNDLYFKDV